MNDHAPRPKGVVCKCGAPKLETEFFCSSCTAKLPVHLLESFKRCTFHPHFRELNRRAAIVLGLPLTRNQQKRKHYYA